MTSIINYRYSNDCIIWDISHKLPHPRLACGRAPCIEVLEKWHRGNRIHRRFTSQQEIEALAMIGPCTWLGIEYHTWIYTSLSSTSHVKSFMIRFLKLSNETLSVFIKLWRIIPSFCPHLDLENPTSSPWDCHEIESSSIYIWGFFLI